MGRPRNTPERITEADIEAALATEPIVGDPGSADFQSLVELAGQELMRRFREEPSSLPGTFVIKLYLDGMKAIAAGDLKDPDGEDLQPIDLLNSLDALPPEHAVPLLEGEIARLEALRGEYLDAVTRLRLNGGGA